MKEYAKIIRDLREKTGKSQDEMAELLGMPLMSYFDLELHDDELFMAPVLYEVKKMCDLFGISPIALLNGNEALVQLPVHISFEELMERIKEYLVEKGQTQEQFEDETGWSLSAYLSDPEKLWDEPIIFLQNVCGVLGIGYLAAIPN
jgi:transcriptional regulator with XRE-family HTH domain